MRALLNFIGIAERAYSEQEASDTIRGIRALLSSTKEAKKRADDDGQKKHRKKIQEMSALPNYIDPIIFKFPQTVLRSRKRSEYLVIIGDVAGEML